MDADGLEDIRENSDKSICDLGIGLYSLQIL